MALDVTSESHGSGTGQPQSTGTESPRGKSGNRFGRTRKTRIALSISLAIALIAAIAIPLTVMQAHKAGMEGLATDDGTLLLDAAASAEPVITKFATELASTSHLIDVFLVPATTTARGHASDFSAESIEALSVATETVQTLIAEAPSAAGLASDYRAKDLTSVLGTRYLAIDEAQRDHLRSLAQAEAARLAAQTELIGGWLNAHSEATAAADAAVFDVISSANSLARQTLADNAQASGDAISSMNAAAAVLAELAARDLVERRALAGADEAAATELTALVESIPPSLGDYVTAAAQVRETHQAAIAPPPPPPPTAGGGGGGGGGSGGWCTWARFYAGFPVWEWGPCSQRP